MPVWARLIARSQCEYLAIGVDWETAVAQSLHDNSHWADEFTTSPIAAKAIVHAAHQICPGIYQRAFQEYERQKARPTFNEKRYYHS